MQTGEWLSGDPWRRDSRVSGIGLYLAWKDQGEVCWTQEDRCGRVFGPEKPRVQMSWATVEDLGGRARGPGWQNLGSVKDRGQAGKITRQSGLTNGV